MKAIFLLAILGACGVTGTSTITFTEATGALDTTFTNNLGDLITGPVDVVAVTSAGLIYAGGRVTYTNGTTTSRGLMRLKADGTLDTTFNIGVGFNDSVTAILVQSDGKILVGGAFSEFRDESHPYLVRLDSTGAIDSTFTHGVNGEVDDIKLSSDGSSFYIAGKFSNVGETLPSPGLGRLNADGGSYAIFNQALANTFGTGVTDILLDSSNRILMGGSFSASFNSAGRQFTNFGRMSEAPLLDSSFLPPSGTTGFNNTVQAIAQDVSGSYIVGGNFTTFRGTKAERIARVLTDGTLDSTFSLSNGDGFDAAVTSFAIQPNGSILVGGEFTKLDNSVGTSLPYITRISSAGVIDTAFMTVVGTGFDDEVESMALQSDGKVLVGGAFSTYNGTAVKRLVRIK